MRLSRCESFEQRHVCGQFVSWTDTGSWSCWAESQSNIALPCAVPFGRRHLSKRVTLSCAWHLCGTRAGCCKAGSSSAPLRGLCSRDSGRKDPSAMIETTHAKTLHEGGFKSRLHKETARALGILLLESAQEAFVRSNLGFLESLKSMDLGWLHFCRPTTHNPKGPRNKTVVIP